MSQKLELLPCPVCNESKLFGKDNDDESGLKGFIICENCGFELIGDSTHYWNELPRAQPSKGMVEKERCTCPIDEICDCGHPNTLDAPKEGSSSAVQEWPEGSLEEFIWLRCEMDSYRVKEIMAKLSAKPELVHLQVAIPNELGPESGFTIEYRMGFNHCRGELLALTDNIGSSPKPCA